jgi:hypothetical protein
LCNGSFEISAIWIWKETKKQHLHSVQRNVFEKNRWSFRKLKRVVSQQWGFIQPQLLPYSLLENVLWVSTDVLWLSTDVLWLSTDVLWVSTDVLWQSTDVLWLSTDVPCKTARCKKPHKNGCNTIRQWQRTFADRSGEKVQNVVTVVGNKRNGEFVFCLRIILITFQRLWNNQTTVCCQTWGSNVSLLKIWILWSVRGCLLVRSSGHFERSYSLHL